MREIFTRNVFTPGYTGNKGTKVTPGWEKGTYDVEYKNDSSKGEDPLSELGAVAVAIGLIGTLSIGLVIISLTYIKSIHYLLIGCMVAVAIGFIINKNLIKAYKIDCAMLILLAILVFLINNYATGITLSAALSAQDRASNALFFLFFGGAFLTLVSTGIVGAYLHCELLCVFWFISLAWTVLASCWYFLDQSSWNMGWLSFIPVGVYGTILLIQYNKAKK